MEQAGTRELALSMKVALMYGAISYKRVGSRKVSIFDVRDKDKRVGYRKVCNLDVRGKNILESGFHEWSKQLQESGL